MKLFVMLGLLFLSMGVSAQEESRTPKKVHSLPVDSVASNRANNVEKVIDITLEQKEEVKDVYEQFLTTQRRVHVRHKKLIERANRKLEKAREKMDEKMEEILTDEQYKEFKEYSDKRQERGRQRFDDE
ncbi:hypothetical protein [Marinilabilia rubra]|nr:hypothetical protein [Marinilabilia rubra]